MKKVFKKKQLSKPFVSQSSKTLTKRVVTALIAVCMTLLVTNCCLFNPSARLIIANTTPVTLSEFALKGSGIDGFGDNLLDKPVPPDDIRTIEGIPLGTYAARLAFVDGILIMIEDLPMTDCGEYTVVVSRSVDGTYTPKVYTD